MSDEGVSVCNGCFGGCGLDVEVGFDVGFDF